MARNVLLAKFRQALGRAFLESGDALERFSMYLASDYSYFVPKSQHRTFVGLPTEGNPTADPTARVVETATIVGSVVLGPKSFVGHNAVVSGPDTLIGEAATIGAGAVIKGGVTVEPGAKIADGAVVIPGTTVPAGEYWVGAPAFCLKTLK
mmetsp:Transcript_1746/g.6728  ORF Transcript_1746/g.6728 Transcript_1746/m.6728 type:complete len:151 (-) Transcript_1746:321-773(-)